MRRVALVAALVLAALAAPATAAAEGRWVTAWQCAPHGSDGNYYGTSPEPNPFLVSYPQGFQSQSLRLIATPHAAGTRARIVLSNVFGYGPVTISAATIARRSSGAALVPGTVARLTFKGQPSVTIPAGEEVVSDPAAFAVAPFEDLAVTLAFASRTGPPTYHYNGLQTSFVSPVGSGDQTTSQDGAAFTATTPMRFFLAAVQTQAAASAQTIVAAGDSITDGGNYAPDTADRNTRWPDLLQRRLLADGSSLVIANAGISANQNQRDQTFPRGGPSLEARLDRDVLAQPGLGGVIVSEGINDIGLSRASAQQVIDALTRIAQRIHAKGVPAYVATLAPMEGAFYDGPDAQASRTAVNDWIRTQTVFDAVVDFDAALRDPGHPARLRPELDSGDHLHPNAAGFAAMAAAFDLGRVRALFRDDATPVAAEPACTRRKRVLVRAPKGVRRALVLVNGRRRGYVRRGHPRRIRHRVPAGRRVVIRVVGFTRAGARVERVRRLRVCG